MIVKQMRKIKNDVRELLVKYPEYRDDDNRLVSAFYYTKYGGREAFEGISAFQFLKDFAEKRFPLPDNITRVRRKLQEKEPELRGEKWAERHKLEQETKTDIHEL